MKYRPGDLVRVNEAFIAPGGAYSLMANDHSGLMVPSALSQSVGTLRSTDVAVVLEVMGSDSRMLRVLGPNGSGWIGSALLKHVAR